jgi:hypothetical protein
MAAAASFWQNSAMASDSTPSASVAALSRAVASPPDLGRFRGPDHISLSFFPAGAAFFVAIFLRALGPAVAPLVVPLALFITLGARSILQRRRMRLVRAAGEALDFCVQTRGVNHALALRLDEVRGRLVALGAGKTHPLSLGPDPRALTEAEESLRYALEMLAVKEVPQRSGAAC